MAGFKTVVVVGAGIVGVSTALWLQRDGHKVILIDKLGVAEGASFGNGGVLASGAVVPVPTPGLWKRAPGMVLNPNSPLFLRWSYLPRMAPWLVRYMARGTNRAARATAAGLTPLIGDSIADHQALAAGTGAEAHIVPSDFAYLYRNRAHYAQDAYDWALKRENGFVPVEYDGAAMRAYEPVFSDAIGFGAALPNHGRINDPGAYINDLAKHFQAQGGEIRLAEVSDLVRDKGKVTGVIAAGTPIKADAVLLATGAWSKALCRPLGLTVPLETERGYHLELWNPSIRPQMPVLIASGAFVITPMQGRLRLAGILEFGGLQAGPSKAPFALLRRQIKEVMPDLTWEAETEWMGHRPVLADSLPAIGAVPGAEGAFLGFGHHHVGLTGGAKTGRLLAQMIAGKRPNIDMAPYDPARFMA